MFFSQIEECVYETNVSVKHKVKGHLFEDLGEVLTGNLDEFLEGIVVFLFVLNLVDFTESSLTNQVVRSNLFLIKLRQCVRPREQENSFRMSLQEILQDKLVIVVNRSFIKVVEVKLRRSVPSVELILHAIHDFLHKTLLDSLLLNVV